MVVHYSPVKCGRHCHFPVVVTCIGADKVPTLHSYSYSTTHALHSYQVLHCDENTAKCHGGSVIRVHLMPNSLGFGKGLDHHKPCVRPTVTHQRKLQLERYNSSSAMQDQHGVLYCEPPRNCGSTAPCDDNSEIALS